MGNKQSSKETQANAAPSPPLAGQVFSDNSQGFWKVRRLTFAERPVEFYLVHLSYGPSVDDQTESCILGPREFAALVRERELKPYLHSV